MSPRRTCAALLTSVLVGACGAGDATAAGSCEDVEHLPIQGGDHLIGDNPPPVPYNSQPPTSGWHTSGTFPIAVQPTEEPLSEAQQVSVLERGGVVVSHAGLDAAARTALADHVRAHHDGRVAVTSYEPLADGQVVFTGWGVRQRCDGVDLDALDAFVDAYVGDPRAISPPDSTPEAPGSHPAPDSTPDA